MPLHVGVVDAEVDDAVVACYDCRGPDIIRDLVFPDPFERVEPVPIKEYT